MEVFVATSNPGESTFNTLVLTGIEVVVPIEEDLDGDPDTPDCLRLRGEDGGYSSTLTAGQAGTEKDGSNPLYYYHFQFVPVGVYAIDVKMGDDWHTVASGIRIDHEGAFFEDQSFEGSIDGGVLGTPDEFLADRLDDEEDEPDDEECGV